MTGGSRLRRTTRRDQFDASPATASYRLYPGDGLPTLSDTLGQPQTGASFDGGKIVVTGRAEDAPDQYAGIAAVQVAVVNSAGQYMSSSGTFTSTSPSYRTAFLNSPGSAGSNYSYTTPVIPAGTYSVIVRSDDINDQLMDPPRTSTDITVTQPSNLPPVPSFTYSCDQNVCQFDARGSTDENAELAGLHVELRDVVRHHGQRQRRAAHADLHHSQPRWRPVPGDADGSRRVAGLGHHGTPVGDHRGADGQPAAGARRSRSAARASPAR